MKSESLTVERNESYWKDDPETGQRLPYLDSVQFRFVADDAAAREAFAAREGEVLNPAAEVDTIAALTALETDGATVEVVNGPIWEHLNFQFGPGRLDRNPTSCSESQSMRMAVARAVDRERLTDELVGGFVEPLSSYVDAFSPSLSQGAWAGLVVDPEAAAAHYADALAETGRECTVVFSTTSNNAARVAMSDPPESAAGERLQKLFLDYRP